MAINVPFNMIPILKKEDVQKELSKIEDEINTSQGEYHKNRGVGDGSQTRLQQLQTILSRDTSNLEGSQKAQADLMNFASEGFKKGAQGLMQITQQSFDVLNTIYKELKKSSPLLEAVESLFNLAMQLFFMPLGNKLGEILIPAVIELLDNVVDMWDELGDGGLAAMFDVAITKGIEYLADFFTNVGETLEGQGGILADLGEIFKAVGNFIEHNLLDVINLILDWTMWNVDHLGTLIALIGSFMSLHYALQLATMAVIASSSSTPWGQALGYTALAVGTAGIGASLYVGGLVGYGDGGYIPATPGGKAILVAEEGEGEYVVPESKKEQFAMENMPAMPQVEFRVTDKDWISEKDSSDIGAQNGATYNITNNFYGYTTDELERTVNDVLEDQISRARLRSGF